MKAEQARADLNKLVDPKRAAFAARYFKTGPGEYGHGDVFLGLTAPQLRSLAKRYKDLSLDEVGKLLESPIHDERAFAVIVLVNQAKKASAAQATAIYRFYLSHLKWVNNWDLVDISCRAIVGNYLLDKDRSVLYRLAKSKIMWERRVAIVSTFAFINAGELADTYKLAELLLADQEDLMHKAVGWALRETGKKDEAALRSFLDKHIGNMPRTTLRYAIERFDPVTKQEYLAKR